MIDNEDYDEIIHPLPPSGYYPYLRGRASYETLRQQTVPLRQVGRATNLERLLSIGYKNNRATHYCVRSIY